VRVAGLLLAAGAGRRLGVPKALVTLGGEPLVARGARVLGDAGCAPVLVTVGAAADEVSALLADAAPTATAVRVDGWDEGMGASLRAGLAALAGTHADAVVIALVDQPFVSPPLVRRLVAAAGPGDAGEDSGRPAAVVAGYGGQGRNPVLLRRVVWAQVAERARGDVGARAWLRAHPDRVLIVPCDDIGRPDDLDTPEDLARFGGAATPPDHAAEH
jgi:CTP:molybdopterin cytidylyltransferase MocA